MKKVFSISLVSCLLFFAASAQVLPLDSVLSRIEKNNPALLSYTNKINSANEMVNGARSWMPPMVGTQLGDNPYSFDFSTNTYQLMIFAQLDIPNGKKLDAKENFLKSFAATKGNEYSYWKNQFFAQAKEKYYERYVTEKTIKVLKDNIALMQNMIKISEKQMATGMGDLGSIYKMKARLAEAQSMLIHEENMVKSLTLEMNYLMNADPNQLFSLDTNNLIKDYKNIPMLGSKDALETRSDIQKMNSAISSMKLNQTLTAMESKPDYSMRFEHSAVLNGMDMYAVMFSMSIPIVSWSSKGYKSEVKAMGFSIQAMEQDKQSMINMANQMVNMLILELQSEYAEIENYTKNVIPAYKKGFDANILIYSQNTGDLMKVILAWDDLQMAQMEYLKHLNVLLKAQVEYEREMEIR